MKETFIIRTEWKEAIFELSLEDQATVFKNLFHYHSFEESKIILNNLSVKLVWKLIEPNLKRNIESYDKRKDTSAENGSLGGRPKEIQISVTGKEVPEVTDKHYFYIIHDTDSGMYKVGETSDLRKRRLSIKRPTKYLQIYDFCLDTDIQCQVAERLFLREFAKNRISGDWFRFSDNELVTVMEFMRKNLNYPNESIESLSVSDSVSVSVIDLNKKDQSFSFDQKSEGQKSSEEKPESISVQQKLDLEEKEKSSAKKEKDFMAEFPFESESAMAALQEYMMHRRQLKVKRYTEIGWLKACREWGEDVFIASVKNSISKNYQGLFKININQQTNGSTTTQKTTTRIEPAPHGADFGSFKH